MYTWLDPSLHSVADICRRRLEARFELRNAQVETAFDDQIHFLPTLHWRTRTHTFLCEVSNRPFPTPIRELFSEITVANLPVRVFIAFPEETILNARDFQREVLKAKAYGIGLVSINSDNQANIDYQGISVPLHLPKMDLNPYVKTLKPHIEGAYTIYMDGDARHGVQELGQLVETIIRNLAHQASRRGTFRTTADPLNPRYAQGNLLNELMRQNIIDAAVLGRCRAYVEDRNGASHRPRSPRMAMESERRLKQNFQTGLRILEDLPRRIRERGYRLRV